MAAKTAAGALPDTYFDLVKEFPLAHIRDQGHCDAALAMIERLLRQNPDDGAQEYLDALTDLVEVYEDENHPMADASAVDVLRELMRSHGLNQTKLARAVGIAQSTISAVLGGTRKLTTEQMISLGGFFNVEPSAFLPA